MLDQNVDRPNVATLLSDHQTAHGFGGKAEGLALAAKFGFTIPPTVALSNGFIEHLVRDARLDNGGEALLAEYLGTLEASPYYSGKLIVRSSHDQESELGASTSGLFQSQTSMAEVREVRKAIISIHDHANRLQNDLQRVGLPPFSGELSVVIQPLVSGEYGGIALISKNGVEIEFTELALSDLMNGSAAARRFFVDWQKNISGASRSKSDAQSDILGSLPLTAMRALIGKSIEFVVAKNNFIVVQLNNFNSPMPGYKADGVLKATTETSSVSKLKAMKEFISCGLFTNSALFIAADIDNSEALVEIERFWKFDGFITVRLAKGSEIGLPRGFFSHLSAVRDFLSENRVGSCEVIVHPFMNVTHSFEINVDLNSFYMEHVPGIWESDSHLPPDSFLGNSDGGCDVKCVKAMREAKIAHPEGLVSQVVAPISRSMAMRFSEMASEVAAQVREFAFVSLPINVHAVWDEASGDYQCLNLRPSTALQTDQLMPKRFHSIKELADLWRWNGSDAVWFQVVTERGREAELIQIASALAAQEAKVFVEFGLLSHPAMVLRDRGCIVLPMPLHSSSANGYENLRFQLDIGNDAYLRIMSETAVVKDSYFHIVNDAQPLADFHLLAVARARFPSVVDAELHDQAEKIFTHYAEAGAFFFERGRASFCTSGFAAPHAHFHIVNGIDNVATFGNLTQTMKCNRFDSLKDAYKSLVRLGEYCVFGSDEFGYAAFSSKVVGKRLFRTSIEYKVGEQA